MQTPRKMIRMINVFTLLFLTLSLACVNSYAITLQEALNDARDNNRNIKFQNYKLKSVEAEKYKAVSEFLPQVSANANYGNRKNEISNGENNSNKERFEEIKAEQSLFNGFGSVAKYKEAKHKINSASMEQSDKKQEIVMRAANAYCDFFTFQKASALQKENRDLAIKMINLAKYRKKSKLLNNSDFIKINYEALEVEQKYFNAINSYGKARAEFHNLISVDDENLVEPKFVEEKFNRDEVLQTAISSNPKLKSSYYDYQAAKSAHFVEKSKMSPTVSVVASSSRQRNVVFLNQADLDTQSVYLNLSVPIFQGGVEYANIIKAGHERSAAKEEYEITRDDILRDVKKAMNDYELALDIFNSSKYMKDLSQDRLKIYKARAKRRVVDKIEYIRAQIEYNNKKIENIEAKMNLIKAQYRIKYFLGKL